jgi:hypothetical protein
VLIWKSHRLTALAAGATLGAHSIVMILIRSVYQDVVAPDSLRAMTVRIIAWMIIIALISPQWWGEKRTEPGPSAR